MDELTPAPPPTIFDTYVPGLLSSQMASMVGAVRTAAFEVVAGDDGTDTFTLRLRHYWPPDEDEPSAQRQADALRQYVIPHLITGKDGVIEVPQRQGLVFKRFVLLMMVRDERREIRGVGALVVDCTHKKEAERRLQRLLDSSVE